MPEKKQLEIPRGEPAEERVDRTPLQSPRKTKLALLLELIGREGGATREELASATGWLPHTVRAAITRLRKRGDNVQFEPVNGISRYILRSSDQ